jgi:hypothetical protein
MHWKCSSRHHFITLLQQKITSKASSVHLPQISTSSPICMRTILFSAATHRPSLIRSPNAPMWRHTHALPIESKQATHRHSQFLQKKSIQPTIILNFDFWMKELKELSSLLQFACSTSTREPLYTTYTKHKSQKKLWHKLCCNPSAPSSLSIIQRQKSLSPSGMALPCNKSSIGNACRKFLQVGYGPIRQFCAPKTMQFVAGSLFLSLSNWIASEVSSVFYLAELDNNLTSAVKRFYLHDISKEKMKSRESRGRLTGLYSNTRPAGHNEPASSRGPWRMDGKWSRNSFLLGSSYVVNPGDWRSCLFLLPTY